MVPTFFRKAERKPVVFGYWKGLQEMIVLTEQWYSIVLPFSKERKVKIKGLVAAILSI